MNRYKTYKDSGIPWLGEVPEHWEIIPIRYLFQFKNNLRIPLSAEERGKIIEKIYPYYGASGIIDYVDNFIFDEDLILVAEDGANLLSRSTPLAFIAAGKYWVNNHAHILKPLSHIIKFWQYLLQIYDFLPLISGSAQPKLTKDNLASILLPTPPVEEQTAIAHYLDTKLGEIDALIGKQQTLLEKLAEQRTAVITHAVTKGLNPAAPMKNSGVEWLGEVPAHWEVKRLKFSISNISQKVESQTSDLRYFGLENIESFTGKLLLDIELESEGIANKFRKNDVLFGKLRPYLAKVHLSEQSGLVSTEALVFRTNQSVNSRYLFYFCVSSDFIDAVNGTTFGSKMPRASWEDIGNFKMLIPSLEEQTAIADYLDQETAKIDRLCDTVNQTIGRLKEYRTALITQAVTGKIKVTDE